MYERIAEVPFIASTTADSLLARLVDSARGREKLRQTARAQLGITSLGQISFGRKGRAQIEAAMLLPYTRIFGTTPLAAKAFFGDLESHGVLRAFSTHQALASRVMTYLKESETVDVAGNVSLTALVNRALARLASTNMTIRSFAESQRNLMQAFSRSHAHFLRLPGQLVRIEGDEALVSVWNEETSRDELRSLDASQVRDIGVEAEGATLIVYEMEYVPGIRISAIVPGVLADSDPARDLQIDRELDQYETPLPTAAMLRAQETQAIEHNNSQMLAGQDHWHRSR